LADQYPKKKTGVNPDGSKKQKASMTPFEQVRDPGHVLAVSMRASPLKRDLLQQVQLRHNKPVRTVFLAPNHRWNYDYSEQVRLAEVYDSIKLIDPRDISDKVDEQLEFITMRNEYEEIQPEIKEVMPILKAVTDFSDFCVVGSKEPLLSRLPFAVERLKDSAKPALSSELSRVKSIAEQFVQSVDKRFGSWFGSDLILASTFLDPYMAHKMKKVDFLRGKDIVLGLMPKKPEFEEEDLDMFAEAGLIHDKKTDNEKELLKYLEIIKDISKAPPAKMPSSISFWGAEGNKLPGVRRVYMNLGTILMSSVPSEAVFNQLALTVTDRRGSLLDERSSRLTVSAMLARMDISEMLKEPVTKMITASEDAIQVVRERLEYEAEGVLSAKFVDLVADEYKNDSDSD